MARLAWLAILMSVLLANRLSADGSARELLQQADVKIWAEDFAAAERILLQARKLDPSDVEVLYRLGYVQFRERKLAAARVAFAEVVKTAPPAWYSRYFLGRICLLENKPGEAVTWLEPPAQIASAYAGAGLKAEGNSGHANGDRGGAVGWVVARLWAGSGDESALCRVPHSSAPGQRQGESALRCAADNGVFAHGLRCGVSKPQVP